ncbi:MAG: biotin/lipoyl-containing protein [Acidobacteriota bacterium]
MNIEAEYDNQVYRIQLIEQEGADPGCHFEVKIEGPDSEQVLDVRVISHTRDIWTLEIDGKIQNVIVSETQDQLLVDWDHRSFPIQVFTHLEKHLQHSVRTETEGRITLHAQMPGQVISVMAKESDKVQQEQGLVIIEAMKMQNEIRSPKSGTVKTCNVEEGAKVSAGDILFEIE